MAMFDFLGGGQYTGGGLRMSPQSQYADGIGFKPPTLAMAQGDGMTMASMPQGFGQMPSSKLLDPNMAMFAMKMLKDNQPVATKLLQNNIPMGRLMSYQDIMKNYGITGLMG